MSLNKVPAVFARGGTSKAIIFEAKDLPEDTQKWDEVFLKCMGSPDSFGRQLNGMGGGSSSLSKVAVISPSQREDADVDYTFGQVFIREAKVDYKGNCGNISSIIGPLAVDKGLVKVSGDTAAVRIYNTNTKKVIEANFPIKDGKSIYSGDLKISGVSGAGAPIQLCFLNPGGATTGKLLPTGKIVDKIVIDQLGEVEVTLVDAANATVFVRAKDFGVSGCEDPKLLEQNKQLMINLDELRRKASMLMGIAQSYEQAAQILTVPYVVLCAENQKFISLEGEVVNTNDYDLSARALASGQMHQALPLTVSLCTAVAAKIKGSLVHQLVKDSSQELIRLGMPSGVLAVGAKVELKNSEWHVQSGVFYRTARPLFEGIVTY